MKPKIAAGPNMGRKLRQNEAFTLAETLVSIAIAMFAIVGLITGFIQSARQAETSGYFLAAQALASQGLEQTRAAKWDLSLSPTIDQLVSSNFPIVGQIMDVPGTGSRPIYGTNVTTISTVSSNPPLKMIRVDCAWTLINGARYTNSVFTYRAPDQFLP